MRDEVDLFIVDGLFPFDGAIDVQVQQVTKLDGAFHRVPRGCFRAKLLNDFVHLVFTDRYRFPVHLDTSKIAQVHQRL